MRSAGEQRWRAWQEYARPAQIPHPTKSVSALICGRGYGKTRSGAEWLAHQVLTDPGAYGLIGPDYAHLRTECLEAYLYDIIPENLRHWRGDVLQLDLANGSLIKIFTAKVPDKVRGPNLKGYWMDEPGEMRHGMNAWDNAQFATRIPRGDGGEPQAFVTGTPKRVELVKMLVRLARDEPDDHHLAGGKTSENIDNLSRKQVERLYARYEGTKLGLQELEGVLLDDVDGALMRGQDIAKHRALQPNPSPNLRVMSIDPGFSSKQSADEVGMIIGQKVGHGNQAIGEILDDCSTRGTPGSWGDRIVDKTVEYGIDVIVYEGNLVGQWVRETITETFRKRGVKMPRLESVTSRSSKWARAEPVAALAEKGRYRMVGEFGMLESELTSWVPDSGMRSPNRLDAWAQMGRYLLIKTAGTGSVGPKRTRRVGSIG